MYPARIVMYHVHVSESKEYNTKKYLFPGFDLTGKRNGSPENEENCGIVTGSMSRI